MPSFFSVRRMSIPGASAGSYPAVPQLSAEKKELRLDVDMLVNDSPAPFKPSSERNI